MTVLVDSREKSTIPENLTNLGVPTVETTLSVGDYLMGNVPVSAKSVDDYLASMESNHLANELYELSTNYPKSVFLVHGSPDIALFERETDMSSSYFSSLAGSLYKQSPTGEHGTISVITVSNEYHAALFIKFLHNKTEKNEPRLPSIEHHQFSEKEQAIYTLSTFPLLGRKTATELLDRFGSLEKVCLGSLESLLEVKGIGPKTALAIYNYVRSTHLDTISLPTKETPI